MSIESNFKVGSYIKCVSKNKMWFEVVDRQAVLLEVDKIYRVRGAMNSYGSIRNGPMCVFVRGDNIIYGVYVKSSNFVKSSMTAYVVQKIQKFFNGVKSNLRKRLRKCD